MKVLWVTNILFAHHLDMIGKNDCKLTSGSWLYAAYDAAKRYKNIELHIVTVSDVDKIIVSEKDGNVFYILPGNGSRGYDINSKVNLEYWQRIRESSKPDVAIFWGTECRFAYVAMKAMQGVPMVIYMQGVIESICDHYYEGMPQKYHNRTLRDFIDRWNKNSTYRTFCSQVPLEREMLRMATGVIVENDWCEDMCKSINPDLKVFRNYLPIRNVFQSRVWSINDVQRYSIFTNAGGYPIKGHHILFQAFGYVKKAFPNFRCYIPGPRLVTYNNIKRQTGYTKMLYDLIRTYDLSNNVVYTGALSSEQMVEHLAKCNVYVMPSVMENHSSSLIEAMMVGTPSISSLVGGTASLVKHRENAILYNSLDTRSLAGNIIRVFEDDALAISLSKNAIKIREHRNVDFGEEMNIIYKQLFETSCIQL